MTTDRGYYWADANLTFAHAYIMPAVYRVLDELKPNNGRPRLFDLGCGNGAVTAELARRGWDVTGVDPSEEGIEKARTAYPRLRFEIGSAYDPLAEKYGQWPVVLSLEVVEHLYDPAAYARCLYDLLEPGGRAVLSTPYHGFWKNLAISLVNGWDAHFTPLWPHGHIKFFSPRTLGELLNRAGLEMISVVRVGRIPPLAKSFIAVVRRPK